MLPERQTQNMIAALAGSMAPATLAATISDLGYFSQESEYMQGLQDFAERQFRRQLICMVGEHEAAAMLNETCHACPGCKEAHIDKLVWQNDETVTCAACGMNYAP